MVENWIGFFFVQIVYFIDMAAQDAGEQLARGEWASQA